MGRVVEPVEADAADPQGSKLECDIPKAAIEAIGSTHTISRLIGTRSLSKIVPARSKRLLVAADGYSIYALSVPGSAAPDGVGLFAEGSIRQVEKPCSMTVGTQGGDAPWTGHGERVLLATSDQINDRQGGDENVLNGSRTGSGSRCQRIVQRKRVIFEAFRYTDVAGTSGFTTRTL